MCSRWQADGLQPDDRLLILMENRPEWAVTAIASCMYGLVSVPAYTTHKDHEVQYLIEKSDAVAAVVSDGPLHDLLQSVVTPGADFKLYVASDVEKPLFPDITDGEFTLVENREPDALYACIAIAKKATMTTNARIKIKRTRFGNTIARTMSKIGRAHV